MIEIIIFGAGKIGVTLAHILSQFSYQITLVDEKLELARHHFGESLPKQIELRQLDINDKEGLAKLIKDSKAQALISSLPYFCNPVIAKLAQKFQLTYFDFTEDIATVELIDTLAKTGKNAYVPQCGVAPGLINIVASDLINQFDEVMDVQLRCGALPVSSSNALGYALTWSVDGLINEYGNPCQALVNHVIKEIAPLEDLEEIQIDGANYEAFNTSGGAGSLVVTYQQKAKNLNYKTIRYAGHCDRMRFLMKGLNLNEHRDILKEILVQALPNTIEDVVLVYVAVSGFEHKKLTEKTFIKKFYPKQISEIHYSAIQMVTVTSAAVIIDLVLNNTEKYKGRVKQENFSLEIILKNRVAVYLNE